MVEQRIGIAFEEATEADIADPRIVMMKAFDDDAQRHLGKDRGGPDGYDNGDFLREWLFGHEETDGHKLIAEGKVIGGIVVWIYGHQHNTLGTIFVDPAFQDSGVGTEAWQFIESTYPRTRSWKLTTPEWATKNHYCYEKKCGFRPMEEHVRSRSDLP